jgi:hypothetical protein
VFYRKKQLRTLTHPTEKDGKKEKRKKKLYQKHIAAAGFVLRARAHSLPL